MLSSCASPAVGAQPDDLGRSSVIGVVYEALSFVPLQDVAVCLWGRATHCTTTDSSGRYELTGLPDDEELMVSLEGADHVLGLRMFTTGDARAVDLGGTLLTPDATVAMHRTLLSIEEVEGTGYIAFFALDAASRPAVFLRADLVPEQGDGPFYFDDEGEPDPMLLNGPEASGFYYNVPAGDYALALSVPSGSAGQEECVEQLGPLGWGRDEADVGHRARVVAGAMTFVVAVCPHRLQEP